MNIEPFGYFKAEPFGWTDCAETEAGAVPLYERSAIDNLEARVREMDALNETRLGEIRTTLQLLADARREAAEAQATNKALRMALHSYATQVHFGKTHDEIRDELSRKFPSDQSALAAASDAAREGGA